MRARRKYCVIFFLLLFYSDHFCPIICTEFFFFPFFPRINLKMEISSINKHKKFAEKKKLCPLLLSFGVFLHYKSADWKFRNWEWEPAVNELFHSYLKSCTYSRRLPSIAGMHSDRQTSWMYCIFWKTFGKSSWKYWTYIPNCPVISRDW